MLSLFICGYSEDNLKCSIKEDKEIFNLLKDLICLFIDSLKC